MSKMIRVDDAVYEKISHLQITLGSTKQAVVQKAIDRLDRNLLLADVDAAFKKLKRSKKAWEQECAERQEWEFLKDGFDHD